jgi:hypothetical protein
MGEATISLGLGLGGGKLGTVSGRSLGPSYAYDLDDDYGISVVPNLHLDASILDGADAGNNPSNGDAVATWGDRSGNNNDFTEATNQPLFRSSLLRGKAGVEFDGSNDILSDADFFSSEDFSGETATMVVVGIPGRDGSGGFGVGTSDANYQFVKTSGVTNSTDAFGGSDYSANFLNARIGGAAVDSAYRVIPLSRPFINACKVGSDYKLYTNKRQRYGRSMSGLTWSVGSGASLGGVGTYSALAGYICEVLIFNTVISDEDFDTIHTYLSAKYGLNVDATISTSSYALDGSYSVSKAPQFHLDANHTGAVLDSSYNNVTDGNDAYYWKDKANNWYTVQPTASRQPSFASSRTVGGTSTTSSALYFDGAGESLELWYAQWLGDYTTADKTVIIVFEPDTDSNFELLGFGATNGSFMYGTTTSYAGTMRAARLGGVTLSEFSNTNGQMAEFYSDATGNTYDISSEGTGAITQTTASWSTAMLAGGLTPQIGGTALAPAENTSYRFKGWIYEVLIFDAVVTADDKTALVAYAKNKYGI